MYNFFGKVGASLNVTSCGSEQGRNKYFGTDETPADLVKAAINKLNPVGKELEKLEHILQSILIG